MHSGFDSALTALRGINLVEASAGTGKTHAITEIYERLICESGARVEEILVVTYTKAATAELKDRIRTRLVSAQRAACDIKAAHCSQGEAPVAEERLARALRNFDRAAIYTIHGFCQRVLEEHAFEGGQPFECEVLVDDTALLHEIVRDFWRAHVWRADADWAEFLAARGEHPETLARWLRRWMGRSLEVRCSGAVSEAFAPISRDVGLGETLREVWRDVSQEVRTVITETDVLNRGIYKPERVAGWLGELDSWSEFTKVGALSETVLSVLETFSVTRLRDKTRKGLTPPEHPFFKVAEEIASEARALNLLWATELAQLRSELLRFADVELVRRNRETRARTFDDLVGGVVRALRSDTDELVSTLRTRYPFALVDEFQDTDLMQLELFRTIYGASGSSKPSTRGAVFFVGDPKQSIYGFRGADVFAYLDGRRLADRVFSLNINRRSLGSLVEAVNALFSNANSPFGLQGIQFEPVESTVEVDPCRDGAFASFVIHELPEPNGYSWNKDDARRLAASAVAREIQSLLGRGDAGVSAATLAGRLLTGSDVAVLVRTNDEGEFVQRTLAACGIRSVRTGSSSVFASEQATELRWLLSAIVTPRHEASVKAALASSIFEWTAVELASQNPRASSWEDELERFNEWHMVWGSRGFSVMFRNLLDHANTLPRLLSRPFGERWVTNLLQLGELLAGEEAASHCTPDELVAWLDERCARAGEANEESEQRLESDESNVRVLTVHRAKGLEFPIVFCPFLWDNPAATSASGGILYHREGKPLPVLDLGPRIAPEWVAQALTEANSEATRLLYVALTRAQYRCHVFWGAINQAERSALGRLLSPDTNRKTAADWTEHWKAVASRAPSAFCRRAWVGLTPVGDRSEIHGARAPAVRPGTSLSVRRFEGQTTQRWRVNSFSSLIAGVPAELPDHDAHSISIGRQELEARMIADKVPRGARAGTCIHSILERIELTESLAAQVDTVRSTVEEYGFGTDSVEPIMGLLNSALAARLSPLESLKLRELPAARRVRELEFYFAVDSPTVNRVIDVARDYGYLRSLAFDPAARPLSGYLKGFIDLVFEHDKAFYLADYKTHWLGFDHSDYRLEVLERTISSEGYALQYLLYSVALQRYLQCRVEDYCYDLHFGGVLYLFLRGMGPNGHGVFFDRPSSSLLADLDRALGQGAS